jgi:hypothetical protein
LPAEQQHHSGEEHAAADADDDRMQRQGCGALAVAGAERG